MKALDLNRLNKTYANGVVALRDVDMTVEEGDFYSLLGPNGAGKSTLIGIVSSLVNATSGQASVFGVDIHKQRSRAMAMLGLVPQELNFNQFERPMDIIVNQAGYYGIKRGEAKLSAAELLKQLHLWDKRYELSRTLSGGMKRRLMIARSMVHRPRLLILDEPTAGVDIEIRRSMWEFIQDINQQGTTVILTTHYLEEVEQLCRNVAIIDHGEIIENTTVKELLTRLDVETFVLDLDRNLSWAPDMENFTLRLRDESTLEVDVPRDQDLNRVFAQLDSQNVKVMSMRNKANRLEELFLHLTDKDAA